MKYVNLTFLVVGVLLLGLASSQVAAAAPVIESAHSTTLYAPNTQGCNGQASIQYAYANPPVISAGQTTTLYWGEVLNASRADLQSPNGHREGIGTPGSRQVNPTQTSTWYVVGTCGGNQQQWPITVTVNNAPGCNGAPRLNGFNANPPNIQRGQSTTLSWGPVLNAQSVQLSSASQGGSGVPAPGSVQVHPNQTTTYYLTAWCQGNSVQAQVTVNVSGAPPPSATFCRQPHHRNLEKQRTEQQCTAHHHRKLLLEWGGCACKHASHRV